MNKELIEKLRVPLLDCYGVDIAEAKAHVSTQNCAFIFPEKPFMIRVSILPRKTRQEILSELVWVDDLKQFKQTVCEPSLSLKGHLLEEFTIDDQVYRASMFRTARGNIKQSIHMDPMFFICVGDLLGGIHEVSTDERRLGIQFRRPSVSELFQRQKVQVWDRLSPEIQQKITEIESEVHALPQDVGRYGLCHGDFHVNNFFVEANNIWLFDFDGCCYADYLYDIAAFVQSCFLSGYGAGRDCRTVLQQDILPYFKIGYNLNHPTDEGFWEHLELLIRYRTAFTVIMLHSIDHCGVVDNLGQIKQYFQYILTEESPLDAMTKAAAMLKEKSI